MDRSPLPACGYGDHLQTLADGGFLDIDSSGASDPRWPVVISTREYPVAAVCPYPPGCGADDRPSLDVP